jgi:ADP-heptose:LPS heptosyltransferase
MRTKRQKIPFILKLKRLKNSGIVRALNARISGFFPPMRFKGDVKRILIFRNDKLGDAIVTLPVLRDLKLNYPDLKIDVVSSGKNRFIFENSGFVDSIIELNIAAEDTPVFLKIPVVGGFLLFLKFVLFPLLLSSDFRNNLKILRRNKYDVSADLVGLKRNSLIAKYVSRFTIGPGRLAAFLFYDYYLDTNWVSPFDGDFMTRKIERALTTPMGMNISKRNTSLPVIPLLPNSAPEDSRNEFDIIFHLGTGRLRKLEFEKVKMIIKSFKKLKLLITDSGETSEFRSLQSIFAGNEHVSLRLFESLNDLSYVSNRSKLLFCYDGGQAHYLSQYIRTITIFGPGSAALWKPYEFTDYEPVENNVSGYRVLRSKGKYGHIVIYREIWCSPCFDTGCISRPCLNDLSAESITRIINQYCLR